MRSYRTVLTALLTLAFFTPAVFPNDSKDSKSADRTENKAKIVGKWEPAKGTDLPEGAEVTIEFTKDGKVKVAFTLKGKTTNLDGTYKVTGDQLVVTMQDPGGTERKETNTITKLTAKELETKDEKGKTEKFTRK